jgi:hypothetical protein
VEGWLLGEILRGRSEHSTRSSGLVKRLSPLVGLVLVLISAIYRSTSYSQYGYTPSKPPSFLATMLRP